MEKKRKKIIEEDNNDILPSYMLILCTAPCYIWLISNNRSEFKDVFSSMPNERKISSHEENGLQQKNSTNEEDPLDTSNDLFEQHYMEVVAREFENELDELRRDPSFNPKEMPLLVSALKKGVNIFSQEEKQKVLESLTQKDKKESKDDSKDDL
ncbi:hypothetical protein T552_00200 [Pneumocystis carinii B80]|uniref:Ribosome assembly protein 3 n=1 Tax=Pneumocystis carinii (strain B80) TaxID=1408658 RepID=A0A0W4ZT72_PNEC8|nr:hypothetical protein T552_00200 [Pneumocystis carinii B80]KTW31560.1 hypothetical protein T552_00200 [Pneumocystis carinii B80]